MTPLDKTANGSDTTTQGDPHFDKKLLALLFLVVLCCLIAISLAPVNDRTAQITLVTALTSVLTTIMGGVITLTSGRSAQRTADTQTGPTGAITKDEQTVVKQT